MGGVFRQGPEFPYRLVNRAGPASGLPIGTVIASVTGRSIAFERSQLDLGVDFSKRVDTAAVSAIYSF